MLRSSEHDSQSGHPAKRIMILRESHVMLRLKTLRYRVNLSVPSSALTSPASELGVVLEGAPGYDSGPDSRGLRAPGVGLEEFVVNCFRVGDGGIPGRSQPFGSL